VTVSEETLWKKKCTINMYDDDPFELLSDHRTCSQLVGRILLLNWWKRSLCGRCFCEDPSWSSSWPYLNTLCLHLLCTCYHFMVVVISLTTHPAAGLMHLWPLTYMSCRHRNYNYNLVYLLFSARKNISSWRQARKMKTAKRRKSLKGEFSRV